LAPAEARGDLAEGDPLVETPPARQQLERPALDRPSLEGSSLERKQYAGGPGDPLPQKRRFPEDVDTEPEDNFGAGIFS
jgi:hypothetical protein